MQLPQPHANLFRYIEDYQAAYSNCPSIDEMMAAMGKSRSSIQNSRKYLEQHGYIESIPGRKRNIRILKPSRKGIPVWGEIAAGYLSQPCTTPEEYLSLEAPGLNSSDFFALRVAGDSMIGDKIFNGAFVILRRVPDGYRPANGEVVAAFVEGHGTTLKRFYQDGSIVILQPSNPEYDPIPLDLREQMLQVQGVFEATWYSERKPKQ